MKLGGEWVVEHVEQLDESNGESLWYTCMELLK